jgi:hypothetical protein
MVTLFQLTLRRRESIRHEGVDGFDAILDQLIGKPRLIP